MNQHRPAVAMTVSNWDKSAEAVPYIPLTASQPNVFLFPNSLSKDFNGASGAVEAVTVPTDEVQVKTGAQLADFSIVLDALAHPATHANNRNAMFLPATKDEGEFFAMTQGASKVGLNVAALAVSNGGALAHLIVIEDKLRDKMIIAGPDNISAAQDERLKEHGVTYVNQRSDAAAGQINDFLYQGAVWRNERGNLDSPPQNLLEDLIYAVAQFSDIGGVIRKGSTIGSVIHDAPAPDRSVQITKYLPPKR